MLEKRWVHDLNTVNSLGCQGKMACTYYLMLRKLWLTTESYVSPKNIKKQLTASFERFAGYDQQDSQEFLGNFLDLLHEDLNKVLRKPYIAGVDYKGQSLTDFGELNWKVSLKRDNSMISMVSLIYNKT